MEKQPYSQMAEQEENPRIDRPTALVRRSDGSITPGQVEGMHGNESVLVAVDVNGQEGHKPVPLERLTDKYQAKLASEMGESLARARDKARNKQLGSHALAGESGGEFDHLFDPDDEIARGSQATKANRQPTSEELASKARQAADHKYNQVRQSGGSHEEATAAADRVWNGLKPKD